MEGDVFFRALPESPRLDAWVLVSDHVKHLEPRPLRQLCEKWHPSNRRSMSHTNGIIKSLKIG